jgi:flagellin-like protein
MSRSGLTPVVTLALLLMVTLAVVSSAALWFTGIIGQAQDEADAAFKPEIDVKDMQCEGFQVSLGLRNSGSRTFVGEAVNVYLYRDGDLVADRTRNMSGMAFLEPDGFSRVHSCSTRRCEAGTHTGLN